jgi:hypothetical protein
MSQYDLKSLYEFIIQTPEQGLRKVLVDGKTMTDVHCNLLLKIARACSEADFSGHFEKKDYPKIKYGPAEMKIKEKFWDDCTTVLTARGLLAPASKAA